MNRGLRIGSGSKLDGLGAFGFPGGKIAPDITSPTITISSTETSPSAKNPIPLIFTLSEISTDFVAGGVTVGTGGSLANFAGSGASYTADLVITTGSGSAVITVDVAGNVFHDAAGNGNAAATQFSITSSLILLDLFTIADDNPMTSPRICEPGPGSFNITDPNSKMSVASGNLVIAATGGANFDTYARSASSIAYAAGTMIYANVVANGGRGGISWQAGATLGDLARVEADGSIVQTTGFGVGSVGTLNNSLWMAREGKNIYFGSGTQLWWTQPLVNSAAWYMYLSRMTAANSISFSFAEAFKLGAPWTADNGLATNVVASPGINETTTQIADAIVEMTWQAVTGQTWNLYVRQSDATHNWIIRCDQGGSTVKIIENNAGETERASTAQTFTNGTSYRVVVQMTGNTIAVFVDTTAKGVYGSAAFNNTATGVQTDRAGTNLIAWPRTIAGVALTELNKFTNP